MSMIEKVDFVERLPMVNLSGKFLVVNEAIKSFQNDWIEFCDFFLVNFNKEIESLKLVSMKNYEPGSKYFMELGIYVQEFLGLSNKDFKVITLERTENNMFQYVLNTSYFVLIDYYLNGTDFKFVNGYARSQLIDKFLIFQWSKGLLLFPAIFNNGTFIRKADWDMYAQDNNILKLLKKKLCIEKEASNSATTNRYRQISYVILATKWKNIDDVQEIDIAQLHEYLVSEEHLKSNSKKALSTLLINEIRYVLAESGNKSVLHPNTIKKNKRISVDSKNKHIKCDELFAEISIENYPNYQDLKKLAQEFFGYLIEVEMLSPISVKGYVSNFNYFINYLLKTYPYEVFNENLINLIFDLANKNSFINYIKSLPNQDKSSLMSIACRFLQFANIYTRKAKKNTPTFRNNLKVSSYRDAMPLEMLHHLIDIVKNRPPVKNMVWSKTKANLDWWQHKDVYPVFPLMLLMHLYIPLRGAHIRNLCREKSFHFEPDGRIEKFVINTDKNVNRKQLQEIPCVWEDLNIFRNFIDWHKEYYPNLQAIDYQEHDNHPWEKIFPLMITPDSIQPISQSTYSKYFKKVLSLYQLEMNEKYLKGEIKYLPKVAWLAIDAQEKRKNKFFTSRQEIDDATDHFMEKSVRVAYDIHSIRVTGITRYVDAGFSLHLVALLSGHTDINTMVRVYIKLDKKTLERKLKEAITDAQKLITSELAPKYSGENSEALKQELKHHKLFSLHKNSPDGKNYELGVNIALEKDPLLYRPMIHGICPAVECPIGRENRCSLCPHLITGKPFASGVAHMANLSFARFYRETKALEDEKKKNYVNQTRISGIEILTEEIMGWHQIIQKIEKKELKDGSEKALATTSTSIFETRTLDANLAYLENAYDSTLLGVERDEYSIKMLTIKAIKFANQMKDVALDEILDDDNKAIDYLMNHYRNYQVKNELPEFLHTLNTIQKH